ncbi:MAG: hypothetical protein U9N44_03980, partial [Chloroflexota bacterium]|nr:hypothetical protein [Chloroflexota bacterium]
PKYVSELRRLAPPMRDIIVSGTSIGTSPGLLIHPKTRLLHIRIKSHQLHLIGQARKRRR